jgi:ssDNA-binding replication factor A large subunit
MDVKIKDLKPHMDNLTIIVRVSSKTQPVRIRGKKYASAIIEDETGKIKLNLWRNQVSQLDVGDCVRIPSFFVHMRNKEMQISTWSDIEKVSTEKLDCSPTNSRINSKNRLID